MAAIGLLIAVIWVLVFGLVGGLAAALTPEGADESWGDRWIVRPVILLWIFGGAAVMFLHYGLGWLS